MNQTRNFLILAWLMVAMLLLWEWGKETPAPTSDNGTGTTLTPDVPPPPTASADGIGVPVAPGTPAVIDQATTIEPSATAVTVETDVLRLLVDGGSVLRAELLAYPQTKDSGSEPVRLFDNTPSGFYVAQSGWVNQDQSAPSHMAGFVPAGPAMQRLAEGQNQLVVPFVWEGVDGVRIQRDYILTRGDYAVEVRDTVHNQGVEPWRGFVYRQLNRTAPNLKRGMTNPESFSLTGATWYGEGEGYTRRGFSDFDDKPVRQQAKQSWIAFVQHHFFSAWIPAADVTTETTLATDTSTGLAHYLIREIDQIPLSVAPGASASTSARLMVGPKLVSQIRAQNVPGLDRAVDYSRFSLFALLGEALFWVLNLLHGIFSNWGWSIIGLVLLVKLLMYPLSVAQYKSMAKMRKFQPRMQQLKERYGEDKQKLQAAMMELYKKEKINPVGGCLPLLLQMPIFFALYWVLLESVELRHAPWFAWIQDLTARDPWFILPAINMLVMWATQKLSPMVGVDPMQQKIMQFMPLVFGVMMVFFPSGLVMYWVINGGLSLLQQWWMIRRYSEAPVKA